LSYIVDYKGIRDKVKMLGRENEISLLAKELQSSLSDEGNIIPLEDAYEMAYVSTIYGF